MSLENEVDKTMCASVPCNGPKPVFTRVPRPMSLENEVESSDDGFQSQINAIVGGRAEHRKQSEEHALQVHASKALAAAAERKRLSGASPTVVADQKEIASPSPGKAMSNVELAYHAHLVLSAAKDRNTPSKAPAPAFVDWDAYKEDEVAPCRLNFTDDVSTTEKQNEQQVKQPEPEIVPVEP